MEWSIKDLTELIVAISALVAAVIAAIKQTNALAQFEANNRRLEALGKHAHEHGNQIRTLRESLTLHESLETNRKELQA